MAILLLVAGTIIVVLAVLTYIAAHAVVIAVTLTASVLIGGTGLGIFIVVLIKGLNKRVRYTVRPPLPLPRAVPQRQLPEVKTSYDPAKPPPPSPFSNGEAYHSPLESEPVVEQAPHREEETCHSSRCSRPVPDNPYRAGVSLTGPEDPPAEEHEFCSEWCANQWIREDKAARELAAGKPHHSGKLTVKGSR